MQKLNNGMERPNEDISIGVCKHMRAGALLGICTLHVSPNSRKDESNRVNPQSRE